jgi:hypothetical protein
VEIPTKEDGEKEQKYECFHPKEPKRLLVGSSTLLLEPEYPKQSETSSLLCLVLD